MHFDAPRGATRGSVSQLHRHARLDTRSAEVVADWLKRLLAEAATGLLKQLLAY